MNPFLIKLQTDFQLEGNNYKNLKDKWQIHIRDSYARRMGVVLPIANKPIRVMDFDINPASKSNVISKINKLYPELDLEKFFNIKQGDGTNSKHKDQLLKKIKEQEKFLETLKGNEGQSRQAKNLIDELRNELNFYERDLGDFIKEIFCQEEDCLGRYFPENNTIEIYVVPIMLFCKAVKYADPKSLFVVVLAHELAHKYNHIGLDNDGNIWDSFSEIDVYIKEGLAQFYTSQFTKDSNGKTSVKAAFDTLLNHQGRPYTDFIGWKISLEQMRSVFLDVRRKIPADYQDFKQLIIDENDKFKAPEIIHKLSRLEEN